MEAVETRPAAAGLQHARRDAGDDAAGTGGGNSGQLHSAATQSTDGRRFKPRDIARRGTRVSDRSVLSLIEYASMRTNRNHNRRRTKRCIQARLAWFS